MSCVGDKHPWFQDLSAQLEKEYGVGVRMEAVASQSLSYADLSWLLRIGGVEVLIIDAEGHDCRILQSMIDHCAVYPGAWPDVIQFETMGLNDMQGSYNTEEHMLDLLNKHGYVLARKGGDSLLYRTSAFSKEPRVSKWVHSFQCQCCEIAGPAGMPFSYCEDYHTVCATCYRLWRNGPPHHPSGRTSSAGPRNAQEAQEAEATHTTPAGGARRGTGAQSLTKEKKEKGRPGAREGAAGGASPQHPRIAPMAARHSWISRQ